MPKYSKRTDGNQPQIVQELRDRGVQVVICNWGYGYPDLLLGYQNTWTLAEIKLPDGKLDRDQLRWLSAARGRVGVATNSQEAVVLAVGKESGISEKGREEIAKWLVRNPNQQSLSIRKFRELVEESGESVAVIGAGVAGGE